MHSDTHLDDLGVFVEGYLPDDDVLVASRARSAELGCAPVGAACGATLSFLAATLQARAVVEIGTGVGVSGLYLHRGMAEDGVLTSIDIEPEFHRAARKTFLEAGLPPGRTRLIMGRALDVLPRLTAGGYDLVFVDAARAEYPHYFEQGVQLLRPGGVIAFHNLLSGVRNGRDPETLAMRDVARAVRESDRLVPAVLPVGGGLLVASVLSAP
ncbi:O-methyltransferase [Amycolatopsis magusensis]|uniref:O-methyltransferase YrrM n=1 Tax=Amycolatopsis magusensis TaxID=882444 RepID=A0ABS4PN09_9PSEU|nr:O-methyltransferase [Amycolatopsis magusensis]MBP2180799.1 putative O-methyltransferase YrrM [Amycolatopsis magusensis]MDI5977448.1 O-methyltransferase [Amycolatopsis magusensis]UJW33251.1 O-methyltransferase [Saccharothrix sp. AJ9571]